jgi:peptide/nickel transport system substrate-binding protein
VFFNKNKSVPLASVDVRKALSYAINRKEIINQVLKERGMEIYSPFLETMDEFNADVDKRNFDLEKARKVLEEADWKINNDGIREKKGEKLQFKIYTTDWPDLAETANILAKQWKEIGADVSVENLIATDLQQSFINPREYDALLFGQDTNFEPDLYPFWHSSQKQNPGLNLAMFDNKDADTLLQEIRQESDENKREEKYKELQKIISDEAPAAFLYSPYYLYPISSDVKGMEVKNINSPAWRFADVNKWYIKTIRVKK